MIGLSLIFAVIMFLILKIDVYLGVLKSLSGAFLGFVWAYAVLYVAYLAEKYHVLLSIWWVVNVIVASVIFIDKDKESLSACLQAILFIALVTGVGLFGLYLLLKGI